MKLIWPPAPTTRLYLVVLTLLCPAVNNILFVAVGVGPALSKITGYNVTLEIKYVQHSNVKSPAPKSPDVPAPAGKLIH